eukprot:Skav226171  [mRNA]  locus=scaffold1708:44849:47364:- [translate_table: standard]
MGTRVLGVVRTVMTYGIFVELDLDGAPWGFIAPAELKEDLQVWRGEEGNLKAYVKNDAFRLGEELQVRVLANSAMSYLVA